MPREEGKNTQSEDALTAAAQRAFAASFGVVLKLAPEQGAALWVDGRGERPVVSATAPDGADADDQHSDDQDGKGGAALCVWSGARESLMRALAGERAFESAFVSGRIAVSGDMSVMARLALAGGR